MKFDEFFTVNNYRGESENIKKNVIIPFLKKYKIDTLDEDTVMKIINIDPDSDVVLFINYDHVVKDYHIYEQMVDKSVFMFQHIPKHKLRRRLCNTAFERNVLSMYYIPDKYITRDMVLKFVKDIGDDRDDWMTVIPERYKDIEYYDYIARYRHKCFNLIPQEFRTKKLYDIAIVSSPTNLQYVPDRYMSYKNCFYCVTMNSECIQWVPHDMLNEEICLISLHNNVNNFEHLKDWRNPTCDRYALLKDGSLIRYINRRDRTVTLWTFALKHTSLLQILTMMKLEYCELNPTLINLFNETNKEDMEGYFKDKDPFIRYYENSKSITVEIDNIRIVEK